MHCRKTAGSSIKCYLNRHLGDNDLQIGSWHHSLKNGGRLNKRVLSDLLRAKNIDSSFVKRLINLLTRNVGWYKILNGLHKKKYDALFGTPSHPTAEEVMEYDKDAWNKYFKFCFVRSPFKFEVSDYLWTLKNKRLKKRDLSFRKFLQSKLDADDENNTHHLYPKTNWPIYTIDDQIEVDYIGRLENIEVHMKKIMNIIGIKDEVNIPRLNEAKQYSYLSFYTRKERKLVENLHKKEIDLFRYKFGK